MMPGLYERRETTLDAGNPTYCAYEHADCFVERHMEWIATRRNWSNTGLWRTDLCRQHAWPAEPGCETTIGPQLLASRGPDTVFGLWGWGEPWQAHIGLERAPGSHGY